MDIRLLIVIGLLVIIVLLWSGLRGLDAIISMMTSIRDSLEKIEMNLEESNRVLGDIESGVHAIKNKIAPPPSFEEGVPLQRG